jgi:hypothetical protein
MEATGRADEFAVTYAPEHEDNGRTIRMGGGPVDLKALAGKPFLKTYVLWSAVALAAYAEDVYVRPAFEANINGTIVALAGNATLKNLSITDGNDVPVLRLPSLSVGIGSLEPLAKRANLDNVVITSPDVSLVREKTGVLNVVSLLPDSESTAEADKSKEDGKAKSKEKEKGPGPNFSVEVGDFRLTGGKVSFSELSAPNPFRAAAALDLSARYKSGPGKEGDDSAVSGLEANVTSLRLRRQGEKEDFLQVPELGVKGLDIDLAKRTVTIGEAATRNGTLQVIREKDGTLDLEKLLPRSDVKAASPPSKSPVKNAAQPEWLVQVKKAALERYTVRAVDRTPRDPVTVRIFFLDVTAEDLSTEKNRRGKVSLKTTVNKTGKVAVGGAVGIHPVSADLNLDVRTIELVPLQPYVTDRVNISLMGGKVSARGKLMLATRDKTIRTTYSGEVSVANLATVDKATSEEFLSWNSLHLDGIRVGTGPLSVAIRQVALTDFYSRIVVTPDGTLNVQGIVKKEGQPPALTTAGGTPDNNLAAVPPESAAPPTPVAIETVSFQGGRINFTDHFIKHSYSANLLEVGGRVSGLSSEETRMAEVDLRGTLENYAPLEITGKINPLRNDLFVDLKIDFKDMDLSSLTPYSGRYAGYTIEKGKLSLSLKYLIVNRKLDASNNVFLDQFTFGDAVESPDATKLPVRLAIALLKNRKGEIALDLPLSGSLDDPQFSLGRVIIKIIVNLLAKAATSPFALLGAVFGGGEELTYLEFNYGTETPDGPGEAKLMTLVKALHERPSLRLEIAGHADKEKDREALRQALFDRKVRSQKLKDIPVLEMEKLIYTHLQVTDDDLRLMAQRRSRAVKDFLIASKQVAPERVFLVEPKALAPEKKEKQRDSRVVFVLK